MEKGMRPATAVSNNGPQIDIGIQPPRGKLIARLVEGFGGHILAVSKDPLLPLERHGPNVPNASPDV
jgi:hypothetical protein